jgi:hypothetical protein
MYCERLHSVTSRPELHGLPFEHFQDADRSGKETSRRPGYLRLIERVRTAPPGRVGAVTFYDQDRFHRNDVRQAGVLHGVLGRRLVPQECVGEPLTGRDQRQQQLLERGIVAGQRPSKHAGGRRIRGAAARDGLVHLLLRRRERWVRSVPATLHRLVEKPLLRRRLAAELRRRAASLGDEPVSAAHR